MDFETIIAILVIAFGIIGSIMDKRLKSTNKQQSKPSEIDPFPMSWDDVIDTPRPAQVADSLPIPTSKYQSVEDIPMPKSAYREIMIDGTDNSDLKLTDLTAINSNQPIGDINAQSKINLDFDLRQAVIYSEILRPKYID